mgnify:CR=1 FL=1
MSKRITLYQRLESKSNDRYRFSTDIIVSLLKSKQFYSDLTIDEVKNIIVFSEVEPKSVFDFKFGDFLFEPNLDEAP